MRDLQTIVGANQEFVIFAAQPNPPEQVMAFMAAKNIRFQVLLGSWEGNVETSFMVLESDLVYIMAEGFLDEQETILFLGGIDSTGRRPATIVGLQDLDEPTVMGHLTEVSIEEATASPGYTFNPHINKYFIIK